MRILVRQFEGERFEAGVGRVKKFTISIIIINISIYLTDESVARSGGGGDVDGDVVQQLQLPADETKI